MMWSGGIDSTGSLEPSRNTGPPEHLPVWQSFSRSCRNASYSDSAAPRGTARNQASAGRDGEIRRWPIVSFHGTLRNRLQRALCGGLWCCGSSNSSVSFPALSRKAGWAGKPAWWPGGPTSPADPRPASAHSQTLIAPPASTQFPLTSHDPSSSVVQSRPDVRNGIVHNCRCSRETR